MKDHPFRPVVTDLRKSRLLRLLLFLLIVTAIPLTVLLSQQSQEIRERAQQLPSTPPTPPSSLEQAAQFDGYARDAYIRVNESTLKLAVPLTVEGWINPSSIPQGTPTVVASVHNPTSATCQYGFTVWLARSGDRYWPMLNLSYQGGTVQLYQNFNPAEALPFGNWAHVAFTVDETNRAVLYVNGRERGRATLPAPICDPQRGLSYGVLIENDTPHQSTFYDGLLDNVRASRIVRYTSEFIPQTSFGTESDIYTMLRNTFDYGQVLNGTVYGSVRFVDSVVSFPIPTPIPGLDSDNDTWSDVKERFIGTDPFDACPDNRRDGAWPPDLDNNRSVNKQDVQRMTTRALQPRDNASAAAYNARYDLTTDGNLTNEDLFLLESYLGMSCTN